MNAYVYVCKDNNKYIHHMRISVRIESLHA